MLQRAIEKATENLLKSKKARTYTANEKEYVLDIRQDEYGLTVTTWGWDNEGIAIPKTRPELIRAKTEIQLRKMSGSLDAIDQVALRYYLDILKRDQ